MGVKGRKVRIGIIGCGGIANSHMQQYEKFDDVEVVAFADLIEGRAEEFREKYGVENAKCYRSHTEMLADESLKLDGVSICTYNRQHAPCTIAALEKGINVLLEKPMCVTLEEGIDMMRAEKKSGKILTIGFQPRFDESMQLVKKVIQSGVLGKIYYIQTGGGRRRGIPARTKDSFIMDETAGIGALGDIGCYSLDMVLNALGYPKPLTVTGTTTNYFGTDKDYIAYKLGGHPDYYKKFGVDDFASAYIRMEDDLVIDFRISWAMNMDTPGDTLIFGTEAGLRIPSTDCWNGAIEGSLKLYKEFEGEQIVSEIPLPKSKVHCVECKVRAFLDAIINDLPAPIPTSEIIYNQAILSYIKKSAEEKRELKVEIPEI